MLDVSKINLPLRILFQGILHVIIKKMKYDESYNFEHEVFICHLVCVRFINAAGVYVYLGLNVCCILIMTLIFISHKFFSTSVVESVTSSEVSLLVRSPPD